MAQTLSSFSQPCLNIGVSCWSVVRDRFLQAIEALVRSSTTLVRDPSSWGTRELSVWLQYTAFLPQYIATVEARRLIGKDLVGQAVG